MNPAPSRCRKPVASEDHPAASDPAPASREPEVRVRLLARKPRKKGLISGAITAFAAAWMLCWAPLAAVGQSNAVAAADLFRQPLSRAEAVQLALRQNGNLLQARADVAAAEGRGQQSLATGRPRLQLASDYQIQDKSRLETFPGFAGPGNQNWSARAQIVQPIYEGGRIQSGRRADKLTREQAEAQLAAVQLDTVAEVLVAYDEILLASEQILVQEASVKLLERELVDTGKRFDAGTATRFNVLRAEVAVANAKPRLIKARNAHRVAKNNLVNLLGYELPADVWDDIPLSLSEPLRSEPVAFGLKDALANALERRPELEALRKDVSLRQEDVVGAKSGRLPSVQALLGYGVRNSSYSDDLGRTVDGWFAGAQASWDLYDGSLTRGRVAETSARVDRAEEALHDRQRQIGLQVRTAWSTVNNAREVLQSQEKVVEQAEEALRLAQSRGQAGTGTQLEILDAETALTEARTTLAVALRDYSVAKIRLEQSAAYLDTTLSK